MVRETRHLWVGNLPDNIREDRIREHFKRYGRVQNVKLLGRTESMGATTITCGIANSGICAAVAFMDIKSASKAHNAEHVLDERTLTTEYYEPTAIPSAAGAPSAGSSPAGSGYSGSSSSVNSVPAPVTSTTNRYHLSGSEDSPGNACLASAVAAPATWRGTNDSASEFCRRGSTPATYSRYQRNNSNAPYATPPSNVDRNTPHHRWYASGSGGSGERAGTATGGESTPSTPGGGTESGRRRRLSGSGSSRSDSSSPEPSDNSRSSTPLAPHTHPHHNNHRPPTAHPHQWASTANGRPLAICVRNLPTRSTDSSLKDGLYHEYKKHGKVVWVKVVGQNADRYAVVRFKKPSDVEKALEVSQDKLFFGCKISVAPHQSCDEDADSAKPYETDIDEYHPKATRTLFIGNLEKDVTPQQLRDKFKHFGRIIEIDIKKGSGGGAGYAFCQYASISSVVEAIRAMDGEHVGGSRVKLGFGKPVATTCVWVDGLTEHTEKQVLGAVSRGCGMATSVCVDRAAGAALVHFEQAAAAGAAVRELRRVAAQLSAAEPDHPRLCVDYASRECQEAFYEQLEKHGGSAALTGSERLSGDLTTRYAPTTRHEPLRYERCGSRSRGSSYGRSTSRNPRFSTLEHYDPADYAADRRYRVFDEMGSSPQAEDVPYEDRLQSVVVSPHRARRHRRDSSPEERKHSKERHWSVSVSSARRSRSGSRGAERHGARRRHRRRRDGSRSPRAGTPLRDEPEPRDAAPCEPRRPPRERPPLPMCLPLPKFAALLLRPATAAPRAAPEPTPDAPAAPASPPRPPSASSSSAGSAPHSPSLEERIRSLDEKYEKWNGCRSLGDPPDRTRLRHRLLEVDINEVKPSDVVRSLLAKRSVFDEDSERLEGAARAPSPTCSPRSRPSPCVPRALRYPFPSHLSPASSSSQTFVPISDVDGEIEKADRPADPRLNRPERPYLQERLAKFNESDYRLETRIRMRTPSTDKAATESRDCISSPLAEKERSVTGASEQKLDNDERRRESFTGSDISFDVNIKETREILNSTMTPDRRAESMQEYSSDKDFNSDKNKTNDLVQEGNIDHRIENIIYRNSEDNNVVELTSSIKHDSESIKHEPQVQSEDNSSDIFLTKQETCIKLEVSDEIKPKLDSSKKIDYSKFHIRKDEKCSDLFVQTCNIKKEILDHELQQNHLSTLNSIEIADLSQELVKSCDKNGKERYNNILGVYQNIKVEKENIDFEISEKDNYSSNTHFSMERRLSDIEKSIEDCMKLDKERTMKEYKERQSIDKNDSEKDKFKNHKTNVDTEHHDKEKKQKHDSVNPKPHVNKIDNVKSDNMERTPKDHELEKHKTSDEKSRHDQHRKDKIEKDRRKDSFEGDSCPSKSKREDKYKHDKLVDKSKKDYCDSKRDGKRESETIRSRKSSKDEVPKEICRKDSTDSSSKASHDLPKLKDIVDNNEVKEDERSEPKNNNESCNKSRTDKSSTIKSSDALKSSETDNNVKNDKSEEKISIDEGVKIKNDATEAISKSKVETTEKHRHYSVDSPSLDSKRKERLNSCSSLPSSIGHKRRMSSQDSLDTAQEDVKKLKSDSKCMERRDSKDMRHPDRHKTTKFNKGHFAKIIESKTKDDKKTQVKPPDDTLVDWKDSETKDRKTFEKTKTKKSPKENYESNKFGCLAMPLDNNQSEGLQNDLDFLATLQLRSSEEDEKQKALRKEMKEKKRIQQLQQIQQLQMQQDALQQAEMLNKMKDDKKQKLDEKKRDLVREKRMSLDRKSRDDKIDNNKRKNRKSLQSTDSSDSDEPKKHSIFDIVDDGPTYISMYDKVKARSCKNMQKQEEEKRQEKIKAKFSQLKQSRAKREEKKRSSWDEDSDSGLDRRKSQKMSMDSSSEDEEANIKKRERVPAPTSSFRNRNDGYFSEDDSRNKLSRKNSTRIISDTSEDETSKRSASKSPSYSNNVNKESMFHTESLYPRKDADSAKELRDVKIKKNSLLNLFGKSDSDDSKLKSNSEADKTNFIDFSSESETTLSRTYSGEIRRKHKKKTKKHKVSLSDDDKKLDNSDLSHEHKQSQKSRRHSNKKEKRKEKIRDSVDTDENRDERMKLKKSKKPNNYFDGGPEFAPNIKKEDRMEDIFGPLSDESDDNAGPQNDKIVFSSHDYDSKVSLSSDQTIDGNKIKEKEDNKRKKEKKRKEKRYLVKEDENSLDVDAVSKAIEARLFAYALSDCDNTKTVPSTDVNHQECQQKTENNCADVDMSLASPVGNKDFEKTRKESREKKKKKKKNREDRQNRKDYNHPQNYEKLDKLDQPSSEKSNENLVEKTILSDIPLPTDSQMTTQDELETHSSLPNLLESPSLSEKDSDIAETKNVSHTVENAEYIIKTDNSTETAFAENKAIEVDTIPMPPPLENMVDDISKVPLPEDPAPNQLDHKVEESFIHPSSTDINVSEKAVRSISNLDEDKVQASDKPDTLSIKVDEKPEEKPRATISQEETEDAVAALLGESFRGKVNTFEDCYEKTENISNHGIESSILENENIPEQDAEEMRQAVQNLNASEMEVKPDTPVSDSDLLLIDTDTEDAEESTQDAIDKLPVNIIATNQSLTTNTEKSKSIELSTLSIPKVKTNIVSAVTSEAIPVAKLNDKEMKYPSPKRDTIQHIASTASSIIPTWALTNTKLLEPHVLNIQKNALSSISKTTPENKTTHITANIVQLKSPTQNIQMSNSLRPIISPNRVTTPYQVVNQMIRPQTPSMQPPTIKIPSESHILYQKPSGIVISPRISNDPRLQSPKTNRQGETITSPRLGNMTILSTPQNMNSIGLASPTMQQRSPGQVTVVKMQQPPLSPLQGMHLPHGARTMLSPTRPNSVLVQTQGAPIHFNRLPLTPVLAPISKQISAGETLQTKGVNVSNSSIIHQTIITEGKKSEPRNISENVNENSKIILSPNNFKQNSNPTVMAQNRLISMQNSLHVGNINTSLHLPNKVLVNSINQLNDKREPPKLDQLNQISFGSPSMIHVTGVNPSTGCVIQSSAKPIVCSIQEGSPNRGQNPNVIHALSSPRLLTTPISKVLQIDANKTTPSVLSMATIRSPTVLTRLGSSNCVAATTPSLTSVVMTPLLLKSTSSNIRLHPQNDVDHIESQSTLHNQLPKENEDKLKEKNIMDRDEFDSVKKSDVAATIDPNITKCDTDFEELLKDNTNEIKVSNDPDKKLEVNVGKSVTLFSPCVDKIGSHGNDQDNIVPSKENSLDVPVSQDKENNIFNGQLENESSGVSAITITTEVKQDENNQNLIVDKTSEITNENSNSKHDQSPIDEVKAKLEPSDPPIGKENHVDLPRSVSSESVIKKVDSVCNESFGEQNEVKEVNSKDLNNSIETNACTLNKEVTSDLEQDNNKMEIQSVSNISESTYLEEFIAEKPISSGKRGGRSMRGKKNEKNLDRVQTRQISKPGRGTATKRGRGRGKVDKKIKNLVNNSPNNIPGDVYDFHEDSGDETSSPKKSENRPRLILTIKSPLSGQSNAIATSTLSIQKDQIKAEKSNKEQEKPEDFNLPSGNTRKSRRLLEKDVQKSTTVDDIVEDGVKILTTQTKVNKESGKKRSARQAGVKASNREKISGSDTRKSPRGVKRSRNASLSDGSMDSSDEKLNKKDSVKDPKIMKLQEQTPSKTEIPEVAVKPHMHIVTNSNITTTPIMKPPKKMISEISAKLASVLENTTSTASIRTAVVSSVQSVCDNRMERTAQAEFDKHAFASRDLKNMEFTSSPSVSELKTATAEALPEQRFDDIRYTHRVVDNVPGHKMPVGATEASDARVQSPALPHRPSATHRPGDRATPLSISIGEGESAGCASVGPSGVGGVGVVAGGGGSVVAALGAAGRGARPLCAAASLPRGAHQPLAPLGPPGQLGPQQPHAPAPLAPHAAHVPPAPLQPRAPLRAKQVAVVGPHHHHQHPSVTSRVAITGVPTNSPQGQMAMGDGMYPHFSHQHYQMYQQHFHATQHENRPAPSSPYTRPLEEGCEAPAPPPPLELRRPPGARVPRPAHSPADRIMYAVGCGRSPPPAHGTSRLPGALPPLAAPSPPHASQVPHEADSLQNLLTRYPVMWQGLLALKNDAAAVQMHFVDGNPDVAGDTLPRHTDGSTPPLRIAQRMRLEPLQLDQVHRKMMLGNEHCILLALPCGRDHMDVLQQSNNLTTGFITYLQRKQAAGIVNVAPPGHQQPMYTVHIFPSCDFANENLNRIAPDLMHRVANIAHLLIVIATV